MTRLPFVLLALGALLMGCVVVQGNVTISTPTPGPNACNEWRECYRTAMMCMAPCPLCGTCAFPRCDSQYPQCVGTYNPYATPTPAPTPAPTVTTYRCGWCAGTCGKWPSGMECAEYPTHEDLCVEALNGECVVKSASATPTYCEQYPQNCGPQGAYTAGTCEDSDGGVNEFVTGFVKVTGPNGSNCPSGSAEECDETIRYDGCDVETNGVIEFYCAADANGAAQAQGVVKTCASGSCASGRCV